MPTSASTFINLLPQMSDISTYFKNPIVVSIATIISVASLHYFVAILYYTICIPRGLFGVCWNIISLGSPFCHAINTIQYKLSENYLIIWSGVVMSLVAWFASKIK